MSHERQSLDVDFEVVCSVYEQQIASLTRQVVLLSAQLAAMTKEPEQSE